MEFRYWQRTWRFAFRSLHMKIKALEVRGMRLLQSMSPYIDTQRRYFRVLHFAVIFAVIG